MIIRKSVWVELAPEAAFRLFCEDIGEWWPRGFAEASKLAIDHQIGGRLFERRTDGTEYEIGRVTAYDPPSVVGFTWKAPSWNRSTQVEIRFRQEATGTRIELEHSGWETDPKIGGYRDNYETGWGTILDHYHAAVRAKV